MKTPAFILAAHVIFSIGLATPASAAGQPVYLPVKGNHEHKNWFNWIPVPRLWVWQNNSDVMADDILPAESRRASAEWGQKVVMRGDGDLSYHVDWKNVRLIVVDQYGDFGTSSRRKIGGLPVVGGLLKWVLPTMEEGNVNATGRQYVSALLDEAEADRNIDHVFVTFHEPAFPQNRHVGDSMDLYGPDRDALWTLMASRPKVRAVLVGHTHFYSVFDKDGLRQIDVGGAGRVRSSATIPSLLTWLDVEVQRDRLAFRVWQSPWDYEVTSCYPAYYNDFCKPPDVPEAAFRVAESWDMQVPSASPRFDGPWAFAAISDSRSEFVAYRKVLESIAGQRGAGRVPGLHFLVAVGDIDPVSTNYSMFRKVLSGP